MGNWHNHGPIIKSQDTSSAYGHEIYVVLSTVMSVGFISGGHEKDRGVRSCGSFESAVRAL